MDQTFYPRVALYLSSMKRNFQKLIAALDAEELREEMTALYERFELVRKYYAVELSGDTTATVNKYKKQLRQLFFPNRGRGKRARSASRKVLAEFKAISVFPEDLIELYFYRAEMMMSYIHHRRIDGEAYHKSAVAAYRDACKLAANAQLSERFEENARQLRDTFLTISSWRSLNTEIMTIHRRYFIQDLP